MKVTREEVTAAQKAWIRAHNAGASSADVDSAFLRFEHLEFMCLTGGREFDDSDNRKGKKRRKR